MLTREQILSQDKPRTETVEAFGGEVSVKALTAAERDQWEWDNVKQRGDTKAGALRNVRARLCVLALVDEQGTRLFADGDADALGRTSGAELDKLYEVAARLAGISKAEREEIEKNLPGAPDASSPSA